MPASGRLVVNARDEALQRVISMGCWSDVMRFGARKEAPGQLRARGEAQAFDVLRGALKIARVEWGLLGEHNQLNALAAIAAAEHVGVDAGNGGRRARPLRQACAGASNCAARSAGIAVYDDFAHHPTAIRTTVNGLRRKLDAMQTAHDDARTRIVAVFEPRSNTMKLGSMKAQLPWALEEVDLAFCHSNGLDWDAREALAPLEIPVVVDDDIDRLVQAITAAVRPGDHILCMSNGGFAGIHGKLLERLAARG